MGQVCLVRNGYGGKRHKEKALAAAGPHALFLAVHRAAVVAHVAAEHGAELVEGCCLLGRQKQKLHDGPATQRRKHTPPLVRYWVVTYFCQQTGLAPCFVVFFVGFCRCGRLGYTFLVCCLFISCFFFVFGVERFPAVAARCPAG
jgi:hypothetical protein